MRSPTSVAVWLLGSRPAVKLMQLAQRRRLRVLAYHDVPDAEAFASHLDHVQEHYEPVSAEQVVTAFRSDTPLPRRAIWITFDDAGPSVFRNAMPLLASRLVPATVFVCPGVVDTDEPYWWQVIHTALAHDLPVEIDGVGWSDHSVVTRLKRVSDSNRRSVVARVKDELAGAGYPTAVAQATSVQLRQWLESGLGVGNHSWDHPCLDMCDEEQQRFQILAAHDWLRELTGAAPELFAYPNGNVADASRRILAEHGYHLAALFDHRIARPNHPEISRLRVDADAPTERLAGIASGAHPLAFAAVRRLRRARATIGGNDRVV